MFNRRNATALLPVDPVVVFPFPALAYEIDVRPVCLMRAEETRM